MDPRLPTTHRFRRAALAACCAATAPFASAAPQMPPLDYQLTLLATTNSTVLSGATMLEIDPYVSMNDLGVVAFSGTDTQGDKTYVVENGILRGITFFSASRDFAGAAINNATPALVASRDRQSGSPALYYIRSWPSNGSLIPNTIANSPDHFSSGLLFVDINDSGVVAFSGFDTTVGIDSVLFAGDSEPPVELARYPGSVNLRPQISETNQCIVRDNQNRIVVWPYPSGTPTIAASGFSSVGRQPGISPDGLTFAFSGDRGNGEGAFVNVLTTGGRTVFAVAGEGMDGFSDIVDSDRVGVLSSGSSLTGQSIQVVLNGVLNGDPGIYVVEATVTEAGGSAGISIQAPRAVARVGDTVDGKTISGVALYDPFNRFGSIALWASFTDGSEGVLRADGDRDGDGLLDVWEIQGIDINQDGVVDLNLPALGADPEHKDLFVEIDAMLGRAPDPLGISLVQDAFRAAPASSVNNPDGTGGIELHYLIDQTNLPLAAWPGTAAPGTHGVWPEFDLTKANYFGTIAEQQDPNSANILAAKRLVYRYCVFADQFGGTTSSGVAELPGNDFIVTLGAPGWSPAGGDIDMQAGTFLHELGHTLGLRHGGADDINGKPNYYSAMNYLWQFRRGPLSNYWPLSYSSSVFADLHESALDEAVGVGGPAANSWVVTLVGPCAVGCTQLVPQSGAVDWNGDGDTLDTGIARDLTQNHGSFVASPNQPLNVSTHDDWAALEFNFRDSSDFDDGVHASTPDPSEEISDVEYAQQQALCPEPSAYCDATLNSLGCLPAIGWSGTPSLTGADDFVIEGTNVRSNRWGMLVWSLGGAEAPFGNGTLCIDKPTLRGPSQLSGGSSGDDCSGAYAFSFPQSYMLANGLQAGDTVFCQILSRDSSLATPMGMGFTNAAVFSICQ